MAKTCSAPGEGWKVPGAPRSAGPQLLEPPLCHPAHLCFSGWPPRARSSWLRSRAACPARSPAAPAGASCEGNPASPWGGKAGVRGAHQPLGTGQVSSAKPLQHHKGTEQECEQLPNCKPVTALTPCRRSPEARPPAAPQGPWHLQQPPPPGPLQWCGGSVGTDVGHIGTGDTVETGQDGHSRATETDPACITCYSCPGMPAALCVPMLSARAAHTLPTHRQDGRQQGSPMLQLERATQARQQHCHPTCLHGCP